MRIIIDDLSGPEIAEFLAEHVEEMRAVTPPQSKHALDLDGLRSADVTFWTVLRDGTVIACGAIKRLGGGDAEIKSMRVAPAHRRQGVASALLEHICAAATGMGLARLYLETGSFDYFAPARGLYLRHGFTYCEPFADYKPDPNSVFLTKTLSLPAGLGVAQAPATSA
ncbi:MAG TPA: GNAT family N-acetyltransferase [Egibacteraceae bacterium]|nr:GNAT family N-acetyltransferase [Egibacteraceae bacterium]